MGRLMEAPKLTDRGTTKAEIYMIACEEIQKDLEAGLRIR